MWHIGDYVFIQDPGRTSIPVEVFRVDTTGPDITYGVIDERGRRFFVPSHHLVADRQRDFRPGHVPGKRWATEQYPWSQ